MKTVIGVGMSLMMVALCALGQTNQATLAEQEIRRLNAREVEALLKNDTKAMETLWSDDLVVTNPLNQFVNKQHVLDMVSTATLAFSSYDRQIEYLHFYGDIAIVAGGETVVWAGKMPLAGKTSHLRYTAVWRRQNGTWQEVVRHANIIPPQPSGQRWLTFIVSRRAS